MSANPKVRYLSDTVADQEAESLRSGPALSQQYLIKDWCHIEKIRGTRRSVLECIYFCREATVQAYNCTVVGSPEQLSMFRKLHDIVVYAQEVLIQRLSTATTAPSYLTSIAAVMFAIDVLLPGMSADLSEELAKRLTEGPGAVYESKSLADEFVLTRKETNTDKVKMLFAGLRDSCVVAASRLPASVISAMGIDPAPPLSSPPETLDAYVRTVASKAPSVTQAFERVWVPGYTFLKPEALDVSWEARVRPVYVLRDELAGLICRVLEMQHAPPSPPPVLVVLPPEPASAIKPIPQTPPPAVFKVCSECTTIIKPEQKKPLKFTAFGPYLKPERQQTDPQKSKIETTYVFPSCPLQSRFIRPVVPFDSFTLT